MIEHIPQDVENVFLYLHSAGTNSIQLQPFLSILKSQLPNTYIWAGDGVISGSPSMEHGTFYGDSANRYWFMFPVQDSSSQESFDRNSEAMGASLLSAGAFLNRFIDQIKDRFNLSTKNIFLSGFQHGSCLALATSMMRKTDPFRYVILFEPYILESYYLQKEFIQKETTIICIENQYIRNRVKNWINIETDKEFEKYGLNVKSIVLKEGAEKLDMDMLNEAIKILRRGGLYFTG